MSYKTTYNPEFWMLKHTLLCYHDPKFGTPPNLLIFELEDCLITCSDKKRALSKSNCKLAHPMIPMQIINKYLNGYGIIIFSNQLFKTASKIDIIKARFQFFFSQVQIPMMAFFALESNYYAKPHTGLYELLNKHYMVHKMSISKVSCIGSRSGRVRVANLKVMKQMIKNIREKFERQKLNIELKKEDECKKIVLRQTLKAYMEVNNMMTGDSPTQSGRDSPSTGIVQNVQDIESIQTEHDNNIREQIATQLATQPTTQPTTTPSTQLAVQSISQSVSQSSVQQVLPISAGRISPTQQDQAPQIRNNNMLYHITRSPKASPANSPVSSPVSSPRHRNSLEAHIKHQLSIKSPHISPVNKLSGLPHNINSHDNLPLSDTPILNYISPVSRKLDEKATLAQNVKKQLNFITQVNNSASKLLSYNPKNTAELLGINTAKSRSSKSDKEQKKLDKYNDLIDTLATRNFSDKNQKINTIEGILHFFDEKDPIYKAALYDISDEDRLFAENIKVEFIQMETFFDIPIDIPTKVCHYSRLLLGDDLKKFIMSYNKQVTNNDFRSLLKNSKDKQNLIIIVGPPSSGKTLLTNLLLKISSDVYNEVAGESTSHTINTIITNDDGDGDDDDSKTITFTDINYDDDENNDDFDAVTVKSHKSRKSNSSKSIASKPVKSKPLKSKRVKETRKILDSSHNKLIYQVIDKTKSKTSVNKCYKYLEHGYSIILDDINLNDDIRQPYIDLATEWKTSVYIIHIDLPLEICILLNHIHVEKSCNYEVLTKSPNVFIHYKGYYSKPSVHSGTLITYRAALDINPEMIRMKW